MIGPDDDAVGLAELTRAELLADEPPANLDLAYEGRIRKTRPAMSLAEYRIHLVDVLLDSVERLACEHLDGGPPWHACRADTIREQVAKARYELQELKAGR